MPTDHPAQQLCRIDVAGYTETGRIVTRFFDHIATAEQYVTIAIAAADTCVAARVPFCVANVGKIDEAKSVAREALAEAKAIAATDATQAQTLLRVAMNAVLLFYSFR